MLYNATNASGVVAAIAAAFMWGTVGIAQRIAENYGGETEMLILGRSLGGAIIAAGILAYYRVSPNSASIAIAVLGLAPLYYSYMASVSLVGAAVASLLLYTAPAWVSLFGYIFMGESPGRRGFVSIALGLSGSILISGGFASLNSVSLEGVLLGLVSGLSYALYIALARYFQLRGAQGLQVSLAPMAIAGVLIAIAIQPSRLPTGVELAASAYLAVFTMALPYVLNAFALRHIAAHRVAVISLVEPLTAVVLSIAVLGETLTPAQAIGGTLILLAALISSAR